MSLKLATYNIHRCIGTDGVRDPQRIHRVLQEIQADIIALQEVEYAETVDELGFTRSGQPLHTVVGPTVVSEDSKYGNVLLSRYPALRTRTINISYPSREKRGALDVDIRCQDRTVRIIATHLGLNPAERRSQTKQLLQLLHNRPEPIPTILMGDINEWFIWCRPLRQMHKYFGRNPSSPATYPGRFPLLALDRIWCHPSNLISTRIRHNTPLSRIASDHLPLTATLL
ncbi:MAG: endonuclease/exonuclease/phosphatase family protein [Candidatus Electrothrix sp. GW3-4]|uniref:endonuclease/exonuclease/phosphatase family protein n=1 Tax=Candidatus Electrothrix sp. GW3-4 TaxID=3126740 RepID=UPI0030D4FC9D